MGGQNERYQAVRDYARLTLDGSLPEKAGRDIVEAAIKEGVTITEALREAIILKSGGPAGGTFKFTASETDEDLVPVCSPS